MKVLLVNPSRAGKGNIPVNLPLIYAVLKRAGHEVRLFDFSDYVCFQTTTQDGGTGFGTSFQQVTGEVDYSALLFKPTEDIEEMVQMQESPDGVPILNIVDGKKPGPKKFRIPDRKVTAEILLGAIQ